MQTKSIRIADLVGRAIVTADGKTQGHVVDVEALAGPDFLVTGLLYGATAWLYRWHVLEPVVRHFGPRLAPRLVRWEDVDDFDHSTVRLKSGAEPYDVPLERLVHGGGWQKSR